MENIKSALKTAGAFIMEGNNTLYGIGYSVRVTNDGSHIKTLGLLRSGVPQYFKNDMAGISRLVTACLKKQRKVGRATATGLAGQD